MSYQVRKIEEGVFTISHPTRTFSGVWSFKTEDETRAMIAHLIREEALARREEYVGDDDE
jgi:hypothetical protein